MTGLVAGAVRIDITPDDLTGMNPIGGGSFEGVHDHIHVRVLVLADEDDAVALVAAELIEVGDTTELRERIEAATGIPAGSVLITATHTHNAPRFGDVSPGALAHGPTAEVAAWTELVSERVVDAVRRARAAARPASIAVGVGHVDVNVNRDEYVDGRWVLGIDPDGPSDKALRVLRLDDEDGRCIAVVANYAVHSTVALWTGRLSGDLAGAASRYAERELGDDVVVLWTPGALGDQAPRISLGRATGNGERDQAFAFRAVEAQGVLAGAELVRVASGMLPAVGEVRLRGGEQVLPLPVKRGHDVMDDMQQADVGSVDVRLCVLRIGPAVLVGVSGEVTERLGRRIRAASPLAHTWIVSLANDRVGYLPEDEAYDRSTFEANGSPVQQGSTERALTEALAELLAARPA